MHTRGVLASLLFVHHFIFFNLDRNAIHSETFLSARGVEGAQLKYTWRELEPEKERYDFSAIRTDLAFLTAHRKKLWIQLQDVSFDPKIVNAPPEVSVRTTSGWVAKRWDPAVRARFQKLLAALGRELDGKIEGINLPETAIDLEPLTLPSPRSRGEGARRADEGFTPTQYRDAILDNMAALKRAFPQSVAMQYANFMPGEWLPGDDKKLLRSVFDRAEKLGVAIGNPDLLPHRKGQLNHGYKLMRETSSITKGIAVQEGNYSEGSSVKELYDFASGQLGVTYIFWFAEEPYYERDVLPMVSALTSALPGASRPSTSGSAP